MKRLLLLRQAYGITRVELSKITGIHVQSIIRYESDELYGSYDKLMYFADLYGTTIDFLLERTSCPYDTEFIVSNPKMMELFSKTFDTLNSDCEIINTFLPPTKNEDLKAALSKKYSVDEAILSPHMVNEQIESLSETDKVKLMRLISALKSGNY